MAALLAGGESVHLVSAAVGRGAAGAQDGSRAMARAQPARRSTRLSRLAPGRRSPSVAVALVA
eukprot:5855457-Prymnesium_polylepis.1